MTSQKKLWIAVNLVLGPLVLASYTMGFAYPDGTAMELWGEVPSLLIPVYTANMFVAAAGYMCFSYAFLKCEELEYQVFGKPFSWKALTVAYAVLLLASAAWMPLCLHAVHHKIPALYPLIVVVLWEVAFGSLFVLFACISRHSAHKTRGTLLAVLGALAFCLQTVLLDASIWPWFFSIPS